MSRGWTVRSGNDRCPVSYVFANINILLLYAGNITSTRRSSCSMRLHRRPARLVALCLFLALLFACCRVLDNLISPNFSLVLANLGLGSQLGDTDLDSTDDRVLRSLLALVDIALDDALARSLQKDPAPFVLRAERVDPPTSHPSLLQLNSTDPAATLCALLAGKVLHLVGPE